MNDRVDIDIRDILDAAIGLGTVENMDGVTLEAVAHGLAGGDTGSSSGPDRVPGLRRLVIVEAARRLAVELAEARVGHAGSDGIRAIAQAYRAFSHSSPGLYRALIPALGSSDPEIVRAVAAVSTEVRAAFVGFGTAAWDTESHIAAFHSLLHGFVALESEGGMAVETDVDRLFVVAVDAMIAGLRRAA